MRGWNRLGLSGAVGGVPGLDEDGEDIRVDVILLAPGAIPRHIVNAWQP